MGFSEVYEVFRDDGRQHFGDCVEQGDGAIGFRKDVVGFVRLAENWGCQCFPHFGIVF